MNQKILFSTLLLILVFTGCHSDPSNADQEYTDTNSTEDSDSVVNSDSDTGVDTGSNTDSDTGSDTGIDTGTDTGIDTGTDTGIDTGIDTGSDTEFETGCELKAPLQWSSTGPLISPKNAGDIAIKDPTIVRYNNKYHVFSTAYNNGYKSVYFNFTDFDQAGAAVQTPMNNWATGSTVAPQVFYFTPQKKWYLIYQWPGRYSTNDDITNPNGWSFPKKLMPSEPANTIDIWTICDDDNCYLFFSNDHGDLYRAKTPIASFPNFDNPEIIMHEDNAGDLFEASNVYKIKGQDKYLLLVECYGPRYFRSWTADSLDGTWTPLADTKSVPFAGAANVTFPVNNHWSDDISHGEMIRSGYDEKMEIDSCNMQYLYQGYTPTPGVNYKYDETPYRLGLITKTN